MAESASLFGKRSDHMTTRTVTVCMLQGMAGEQPTLEPGDLYKTTALQAKLWAEHGVAEIVKREAPAATR